MVFLHMSISNNILKKKAVIALYVLAIRAKNKINMPADFLVVVLPLKGLCSGGI